MTRLVIVLALLAIVPRARADDCFDLDGPDTRDAGSTAVPGEIACDGVVVWEQIPADGRALVSQDDVCYPFRAEVADDFVGSGEPLVAIEWWASWWCGTFWPPDSIFVFVREDLGGVPGDVVHRFATAEYDFAYNDDPVARGVFCIDLDGDLVPADGVSYFLSIVTYACISPARAVVSAEHTHGAEAWFRSDYFGYVDWTPVSDPHLWGAPGDVAFVLRAASATPVRESSWSRVKLRYESPGRGAPR